MSAAQDQTLLFEKKNIAETVAQLRERSARLADALEWIENQEDAGPLEMEQRIINATLSAIAVEYGPNYFTSPSVVRAESGEQAL